MVLVGIVVAFKIGFEFVMDYEGLDLATQEDVLKIWVVSKL
jgi:hypothetical protein